jgi:ferrous iron transport protein A
VPLSELEPGQSGIVQEVHVGRFGEGLTNRLEAMGIVPGKPVRVLRAAWLGGPLGVRVGATTEIAIRRQEAALVMIHVNSGK